MEEEYLDIVDENNNPTGEVKPRSEVHSNGYWHRTVHVYFIQKSKNGFDFLIHLRSKNKDLSPNKWDTRFGGHIKSGKTVAEAVAEEIKEELDLDVKFNDLIKGFIKKRSNYPNNEFYNIFFYKFNKDLSILKFKDNEVQEVKWISDSEILDQLEKNPDNWSTGLNSFKEVVDYLKLNIQ